MQLRIREWNEEEKSSGDLDVFYNQVIIISDLESNFRVKFRDKRDRKEGYGGWS